MTSYWLSSKKMTVFADVSPLGIIIDTSPITKKFIGQNINNLKNWIKKQGGFIIEEMKNESQKGV